MSYCSHADLGGQTGHGRVMPEPEDVLFHAPWESRALALTLAMGATGSWNIDMSRAARETLPDYSRLSYYEIWTLALQVLLEQRGLMGEDELEAGRMLRPGPAIARVLQARDVAAVLTMGSPTQRPAQTAARFGPGQQVRMHPGPVPHHTRLPGYVRGKRGLIERVHGAHVFADAHALGLGEQPRWLYTVVFDASELWGDEASSQGLKVSVDAWEPYLQSV